MSAQAFIAFLRCEATQAEERGKALRATAAAIEANASGEGEFFINYVLLLLLIVMWEVLLRLVLIMEF